MVVRFGQNKVAEPLMLFPSLLPHNTGFLRALEIVKHFIVLPLCIFDVLTCCLLTLPASVNRLPMSFLVKWWDQNSQNHHWSHCKLEFACGPLFRIGCFWASVITFLFNWTGKKAVEETSVPGMSFCFFGQAYLWKGTDRIPPSVEDYSN